MSEHLPYEEQLQQQWTDLPLPDENMAWEDMKRRLEEEDEERALILWLRPGCLLWGLLLLLLMVGIGWWMMDKNDNGVAEKKPVVAVEDRSVKDEGKKKPAGEVENPVIPQTEPARIPICTKSSSDSNKMLTAQSKKIPLLRSNANELLHDSTSFSSAINKNVRIADTVISENKANDLAVDSTISNKKEKKSLNTDTVSNKKKPKDNDPKKNFFFTAGVAIQQQLPIGGQKATPYNAVGRSGSLADYIPSVYLRLNRKDKWFIQAEFRYGAPQYTKQFLYEQKRDSGGTSTVVRTTKNSLKKTYYHQLPLTFNYYIKPNWSIGGGAIWNKFYGAIAGQEIIEKNNLTQVETVVFDGTVKIKDDTSNIFTKSYFQAVIESQYKWKRLSFGARYAFGLQPYIRFNLPGQAPREEKNSSLQVFLRLELLRPKK